MFSSYSHWCPLRVICSSAPPALHSRTRKGGPVSLPISYQREKHNGRTMRWLLRILLRSDIQPFQHISLDKASHKVSPVATGRKVKSSCKGRSNREKLRKKRDQVFGGEKTVQYKKEIYNKMYSLFY